MFEEKIEGYFLADKVFAWKPNVHYALFFTSKRIIAAKVGGQLKELVLIVDPFIFAKKAEEVKEVTVESLLKADKDNFEIPYSEIINIEIRRAGWKDKLTAGRPVPGTITIKGREEHKFQIGQMRMDASRKLRPQKFQECVDLLRSVLSDKLSVKG